jgi:hypothetical protein
MQQSEQRVWVNVQFLQRMPRHPRHDSRNEPTRQTHLDNRNKDVALLERGDRAAQIVCLQHGHLHERVSRGSSRCRGTPHSIFRRLLAWLAALWRAFMIAVLAAASDATLASTADA